MATIAPPAAGTGEESLIILQSLLCLLRERNILSRADIEELCRKVEARAGPLSCCAETAMAASADMHRMGSYIGQQYGGKHLRSR
ncbi:hypothetical protein [uncultured Sphingomonas sp.]|uniref:hypothetical protein n=1 Tax=uncultured Sphingomonas sp. TaxID=158754 RepID=UPI0035CA2697